MPSKGFLTKLCLIASALVLVPSCGARVADVNHLPSPPPELVKAQKADKRPVYPVEALDSEARHDTWTNDTLDWGERRHLLAYRWCTLWNSFALVKVDCGNAPPAGLPD